MANDLIVALKNEIVVYQPDDTLRMEVSVRDQTIWLTQQKIGELFGVGKAAISKHLKNIFETGELREELVVSKMETTTLFSHYRQHRLAHRRIAQGCWLSSFRTDEDGA